MRRLVVIAALALVAGTAHAQAEPRRFNVGVHGGRYQFDRATGLEDAGYAGIDATYQLPTINFARKLEPGVGFYIAAALPTTDPTQFPLVAFDFGDTTFLYGVSQRVRMFDYGLQGTLGTTINRFRLYALGGIGMYSLTVDPRLSGVRSYAHTTAQVGGGVNWVVTRSLGVKAEVRNSSWQDYDRNRLDPTVGYTRDQRVLDAQPAPVANKSTVNNLRFGLVFSYIPGGTSTGVDPVPQTGERQ